MNAKEILTYTRDLISEPSTVAVAKQVWESQELLRYANEAYMQLHRFQAMKDKGYGLNVFDWSSDTGGTSSYSGSAGEFPPATELKSGHWLIQVPPWFYIVSEVQDPGKNYDVIPNTRRGVQESDTWSWYGSRNMLIKRSAEPTNLRFIVYKRPPPLVVLVAATTPAWAGYSTATRSGTAKFNYTVSQGKLAREEWAYDGAYFELLDGTPATNADAGMGIRVIDTLFASGEISFTYDSLGRHIAAAAAVGTYWAIVPDIDENAHELICLMAADRAFFKEGNVEQSQLIAPKIQVSMREFKSTLTPRQVSDQRYVRNLESIVDPINTYDTAP